MIFFVKKVGLEGRVPGCSGVNRISMDLGRVEGRAMFIPSLWT